MPTIHYQNVVDLTHSIDRDIPIWPGDPPVEFETVADFSTSGYFLRKFSIGEHSGTHINSPKSFDPDGMGIDQYSPQSCIVSAVVIDICEIVKFNPDYKLTIQQIEAWEAKHQKIPANALVILFTGWQKKWHNQTLFFNQDEQGKMHFPGFGGEATQFLIEQRRIAGLGIDTHGVDPGCDQTFTTNQLILKNSGLVLENLNNLDQLPATGITLMIGIIRLKDGSGSPVSVLALF